MPDACFAHPRLASIYDAFDGTRDDLDHYEALIAELAPTAILDVGCGTGVLATRLAAGGHRVTGVDPAAASLDVARARPGGDTVTWILGDATSLPADLTVDLAVMTGNVAQVFVTDAAWQATIDGIAQALVPGGHLVFETRDPAARAWEGWTPDRRRSRIEVDGVGPVEAWTELTEVALPLVSFRTTYHFEADGSVLTSDSTLRFRSIDEIRSSLDSAGLTIAEIRDAPDRPGLEWVFVATRR